MQSDASKFAILAGLMLVTLSGAAAAQSENRQQLITKAPPKGQSKYVANARMQTTAPPYRFGITRLKTTPGYIAPEPSTPMHAASFQLESTGSLLPGTGTDFRFHPKVLTLSC